MHFNAFWHINTHHQILTSTEIKAYIFFPPHFSNLCMKIVPPLFCQGSRLRPGVYGVDAPGSAYVQVFLDVLQFVNQVI